MNTVIKINKMLCAKTINTKNPPPPKKCFQNNCDVCSGLILIDLLSIELSIFVTEPLHDHDNLAMLCNCFHLGIT